MATRTPARSGFYVRLGVGVISVACSLAGSSADAEPIRAPWAQPGGPGTEVVISYSFSNLFDGTFLLVSPWQLRAATQEALGLWASYAPLRFVELPDSGPLPSDVDYAAATHPQIRIGHHAMRDLAHAFIPDGSSDGLAADIHFDSGLPWTVGDGQWDFLETVTHELGHSLGLGHELDLAAIMNPSYPQKRFRGLGTAFLFPADIAAVRRLYGSGVGAVERQTPVPEPTAVILVGSGLAVLAARRRRNQAPGGRSTAWRSRWRPQTWPRTDRWRRYR
jgi:hypothetical protein